MPGAADVRRRLRTTVWALLVGCAAHAGGSFAV